jgi:hypothetical protein
MSFLNCTRRRYGSAIIVLALAGSVLTAGEAVAQDSKAKTDLPEGGPRGKGKGGFGGAPAGPNVPAEVFSLRLRYSKARDIADLVEKIFPVFVVADERTNSLFFRTVGERFAEIREFVKKVDSEAADAGPPGKKISVFPLLSVEPDQALMQALGLIFDKKTSGNFAVDDSRKIVVVSADPATTEAVAALLARLDHMRPSRPSRMDIQLRVVWLVDTSFFGPDAKAPAEPDDLKTLLPGLAKLGIPQPRVAAQMLVNTQPNMRFSVRGTARTAAVPWEVTASGNFDDNVDQPELHIVLNVSGQLTGKQTQCHLETSVSAPRGHLVVLGVTPTQSTTSAFVVQVLDEKGRKGGAGK